MSDSRIFQDPSLWDLIKGNPPHLPTTSSTQVCASTSDGVEIDEENPIEEHLTSMETYLP
jgi:collagenase-like PrtC family protease